LRYSCRGVNMKRILIVEDTVEINEIWREVFEDEGYLTSSAYDGEEAMRLLAEESFELVILDLMLPGFDGFDVLDFMLRRGIDTPVIAVTGEVIEDARRRLSSYPQVRQFLFKPILPSELLKEVEEIWD